MTKRVEREYWVGSERAREMEKEWEGKIPADMLKNKIESIEYAGLAPV